ncbi:MAG TPA: hypothetical protein VFB21_17945 [Chthonomonadaceae bacterium]|nr:hypothetical protein [Chthonomonadaceae bacterium]
MTMQKTVRTWQEFRQEWDGVLNFLMAGECVPFAFDMPPVEQVIEEVRRDPEARIWRGAKGDALDQTDIADAFRALPIQQAVRAPVQMSHFKLSNFYGPGQLFHGFEEQVMEPWRQALAAAGFTWTRCYPILFLSGPHCATNYHMDGSHVVAWQREGVKRFVGLKDPQRWAPKEERLRYSQGVTRPEGITAADELAYEMKPGDVLWNALLTPHWVEAADQVAYSLNLSHGGLRLNGRLCPHEAELEEWRASQEAAPQPSVRY